MQQGGDIISASNQLDSSVNELAVNGSGSQPFGSAVTSIYRDLVCDNGDPLSQKGRISKSQEGSSFVMETTDEDGNQIEADDVVDGDVNIRNGGNDDVLYSSAVIHHRALSALDLKCTIIAMQEFDRERKILDESRAVILTKVVKLYKRQPFEVFTCSCDSLRSRNVLNSAKDLFCSLQDFNNLYPLCIHIRVIEKIRSVASVIGLQQQAPENCGYCAYENDKEVFRLSKLTFGKHLYVIKSFKCTYGIVEVECGNFNCLTCQGPECQHVTCIQNHVTNINIEAPGVPELIKEIYLQLFSVHQDDNRKRHDFKETVYYNLSNGQTVVVGSSPNVELKLPPEKKRKKRAAQPDARRFQCDNCQKSFKHKHHLREHMHLHTGEQPFECKNCGRKFSHSGSLSQHRQRSCNTGMPCQGRQRNSKNSSSRKSASPRSNSFENHAVEESKKSQQEKTTSPQIPKPKKSVSPRSKVTEPRSNLLERRSNLLETRSNISESKSSLSEARPMEVVADLKAESFNSQIKAMGSHSLGTFISSEALKVPEPVLYNTMVKSHDISDVLKSSNDPVGETKFLSLESARGGNSHKGYFVKSEKDMAQPSSDQMFSEQNFAEILEKANNSGVPVCLICEKKFESGESLCSHLSNRTGESPNWCSVCETGFPQSIQLIYHFKSEEHQRNVTLANNLQKSPPKSEPLHLPLPIHSDSSHATELSFSKPVLSQMLTTPSWDMFSSKSATSLPSISELMSSVTTHHPRILKKEPMSLPSSVVISDKMVMSSGAQSPYSSNLQLLSSIPDELLHNTTKDSLYDPNMTSLTNGKLPMMQQIKEEQDPVKVSQMSTVAMTTRNGPQKSPPVSTFASQSSIDIQSTQSLYMQEQQSSFSQHSSRQAVTSATYAAFPVSVVSHDSALKALCSFTEKPIPTDAAESLAGVTGSDSNSFIEQKNEGSESSPTYPCPSQWNGWSNWNGAFPVYVSGESRQWNGTGDSQVIPTWPCYPSSEGIPTTQTGSQMNSGVSEPTIQTRVIAQPKPPVKPKAPYSRYSIKVWNTVKSSNPNLSVGEMNRLIGQMWRGLPDEEKNQFLEDYSVEKEKYKLEYEKFRTSPEFQIWLASNIDKNSNAKKRPYEAEAEQLEDRQDYRQFIVKAT